VLRCNVHPNTISAFRIAAAMLALSLMSTVAFAQNVAETAATVEKALAPFEQYANQTNCILGDPSMDWHFLIQTLGQLKLDEKLDESEAGAIAFDLLTSLMWIEDLKKDVEKCDNRTIESPELDAATARLRAENESVDAHIKEEEQDCNDNPPKIGMTVDQIAGRCFARQVSTTITAGHRHAQWEYPHGHLYFDNGILTAIQTSTEIK
jgi:hypothetical protein